MKEIFYRSPNLKHKSNNLYVHSRNTQKFGNKSLNHLEHTNGTHFLKTLSKQKICNIAIQRFYEKVFEVHHVNAMYDVDSNFNSTVMFEFHSFGPVIIHWQMLTPHSNITLFRGALFSWGKVRGSFTSFLKETADLFTSAYLHLLVYITLTKTRQQMF